MRIDIRNIFEEKIEKSDPVPEKDIDETVNAESTEEAVEEAEEPIEEAAEEAEELIEEAAEEAEENEAEAEADDEVTEEITETAEDHDEEVAEGAKETESSGFWHRYGSLFVIAAAFIVLMAFMTVYTTMTPRQVNAVIDGKHERIITEEHTIAGFLDSRGIAYCEEDYLSTPPEGFIYDGMDFEMIHATDFQVTADGITADYKSLEPTVGEALADISIKIGKLDIVTPQVNEPLTQDIKIVVQRVKVKKETVNEKVPFKTVNKDDTTMNEGEKKVITKGENGRDKVVYEVTYTDGKETDRKELSRKTIKKAVDEVVANGTRIEYNGKSYSRKLVVKAYSYTGGGRTAMGTRARVGEIAVDPSVIPLGTNVYIEGVGARRAEDTGGNIKGNTIDIYMNTRSECLRWGVRYVTIYIE